MYCNIGICNVGIYIVVMLVSVLLFNVDSCSVVMLISDVSYENRKVSKGHTNRSLQGSVQ